MHNVEEIHVWIMFSWNMFLIFSFHINMCCAICIYENYIQMENVVPPYMTWNNWSLVYGMWWVKFLLLLLYLNVERIEWSVTHSNILVWVYFSIKKVFECHSGTNIPRGVGEYWHTQENIWSIIETYIFNYNYCRPK